MSSTAFPKPKLTPRQVEVLHLVCAGLPNLEIARRLGVAPTTVVEHVAMLRARLAVKRRDELPEIARALGIL